MTISYPDMEKGDGSSWQFLAVPDNEIVQRSSSTSTVTAISALPLTTHQTCHIPFPPVWIFVYSVRYGSKFQLLLPLTSPTFRFLATNQPAKAIHYIYYQLTFKIVSICKDMNI